MGWEGWIIRHLSFVREVLRGPRAYAVQGHHVLPKRRVRPLQNLLQGEKAQRGCACADGGRIWDLYSYYDHHYHQPLSRQQRRLLQSTHVSVQERSEILWPLPTTELCFLRPRPTHCIYARPVRKYELVHGPSERLELP